MLTEQQAVEIFKFRQACKERYPPPFLGFRQSSLMRGKSSPLSKFYGVSPRTIRDIWNRRTWAYATIPFWSVEERNLHLEYVSNCLAYTGEIRIFSLNNTLRMALILFHFSLGEATLHSSIRDGQRDPGVRTPVVRA